MEENPSRRDPYYYQEAHYQGANIKIVVDTLIECEICNIPMKIEHVTINRNLAPYYGQGVPMILPKSFDVEVEFRCSKCGMMITAIGENVYMEGSKEIKIINLKQSGGTIPLKNVKV